MIQFDSVVFMKSKEALDTHDAFMHLVDEILRSFA